MISLDYIECYKSIFDAVRNRLVKLRCRYKVTETSSKYLDFKPDILFRLLPLLVESIQLSLTKLTIGMQIRGCSTKLEILGQANVDDTLKYNRYIQALRPSVTSGFKL